MLAEHRCRKRGREVVHKIARIFFKMNFCNTSWKVVTSCLKGGARERTNETPPTSLETLYYNPPERFCLGAIWVGGRFSAGILCFWPFAQRKKRSKRSERKEYYVCGRCQQEMRVGSMYVCCRLHLEFPHNYRYFQSTGDDGGRLLCQKETETS